MSTIRRWRKAIQLQLDAHLLTAVCCERIWLARALLILGADPDVVGWRLPGLVSALSAACMRHNLELAMLLLAWGADPDGSPIEPTPPIDRLDMDEFRQSYWSI